MAYKVLRTNQAQIDLQNLHEFLVSSHQKFNHSIEEALSIADARVLMIETQMNALALAPKQGTLDPGTGIRRVTKDKAIFYFDVDEQAELIRVLAIFYGGQDHIAHMKKRLLGDRE